MSTQTIKVGTHINNGKMIYKSICINITYPNTTFDKKSTIVSCNECISNTCCNDNTIKIANALTNPDFARLYPLLASISSV